MNMKKKAKKKVTTKKKTTTKKKAVSKNNKSSKFVIKKDMTIASVVKKDPRTMEVFFNYGLHCVGCFAAEFDTIESGAKVHGINVEHLLHDLNEKIKK